MKQHKLWIMTLLIADILINSCSPDKQETRKQIIPVLAHAKNNGVKEYSVTINARDWLTVNATERIADIAVPELTEKITGSGYVAIYLKEGNKQLALPFNYFQVRKILSFQPSYETGHVYITVFGNFVINIHAQYTFFLILISPKEFKKNKGLNWQNYEEVKTRLQLEEL